MTGRQHKPAPVIRASILLPIVRVLDGLGRDADTLLAVHGLSRAHLRDPYAPVLLRRYVAFLEASALLAGDPSFGLRLGAMLQPADLGPAGLLFTIVPTLRQAILSLVRYLGTLQSGTDLALRDDGDWAALVYKLEDPSIWPHGQDSELTLSTMCSLIRSRLGFGWAPLEVHFAHGGAAGRAALRQIFRAPVRFHQPVTRLLLANSDLDQTLGSRDAGFLPALERHAQDLLARETEARAGAPDGLADRVRRLIAVRVGHGPVSVSAMAQEVGMSARSFQRGLAAEGTTLRDLVRAYRQWLAETRLDAGGATMTQIAQAMGYSDATVFWRAFKGWSGSPPAAFRRRRDRG